MVLFYFSPVLACEKVFQSCRKKGLHFAVFIFTKVPKDCQIVKISTRENFYVKGIQRYVYPFGCLRKQTDDVYILPWLSKGREIFNISYFKMDSTKNSILDFLFE